MKNQWLSVRATHTKCYPGTIPPLDSIVIEADSMSYTKHPVCILCYPRNQRQTADSVRPTLYSLPLFFYTP